MGGLKLFQIFFDSPAARFYGGQVVSGRVVVQLEKPKKVRGIDVKLKGEAELQWMEPRHVLRGSKVRTLIVKYQAHEQYFKNSQNLLANSANEMMLPAGRHEYAFSMTLPNRLPSSFEGKYGHVRYTVKAKMDRPWKFDHETKATFTVLQHLDLNADPNVKDSVRRAVGKSVHCHSGHISVVVNLPTRGYVPGQEIPITIEVNNVTSERIETIACQLVKTVKFRGSYLEIHKTRSDEEKVVEIITSQVDGLGSGTWTEKLRVPSVSPSYLKYCNIMEIGYTLTVKVQLTGKHQNMHVNIPLVMGTIPFVEEVPALSPPPAFSTVVGNLQPAGQSVVLSAPPAFSELCPEMPPPSYEACMLGVFDQQSGTS